jgi:branched-chain amino acid transport system ATP-binding protein
MTLLRAEGLTASYGAVPALQDFSFEIGEGEVVVVLGANGAGKTTTLRAISGMVSARGKVTFAGVNVRGRHPEAIARMGIAHVPEGRGTFSSFTVAENLRLGAYLRDDAAEAREDMERWFELFPRLRDRASQVAGSLSGGEQQMLAIARALMLRPRLLLVDEPSMGLAPILTRELFETLRQLNRRTGASILLVEQNANLALDIATRGYVLQGGRCVLAGDADELRSNDDVRSAYLGY